MTMPESSSPGRLSPSIRLYSLGSGSGGNCTLMCGESSSLLLDAGFSHRQTLKRIEMAAASPKDIEAILITHEHRDHCVGLPSLCKRLSVPVYMTQGTRSVLEKHLDLKPVQDIRLVRAGEGFSVGDIDVEPVPVPHNAAEPVFYRFSSSGRRWAQVTDLGFVTLLVREALKQLDFLLIESNHDVEDLMNGSYPWSLKQHIKGRFGHLSNEQAAEAIKGVVHDGLKGVALMHISKENNRPEKAYAVSRRALDEAGALNVPVYIALQDEPIILPGL